MSIPVDDGGFLEFIRSIDKLLAGPAPEEGEECRWCQYRHKGERIAHLRKSGS
jgi:hypothetical protein